METEKIPVKRMRLEGPRAPRPRNVPRVVVEVDCASPSHVAAGHRLTLGINRFEAYADDLPRLRKLVRTDEHVAKLEVAEQLAAERRKQWLADNDYAKADERKRKELEKMCPVHAGEDLANMGLRTGLPPFHYLKVVEKLDPPPTPENLTQAANDRLATAIGQALDKAMSNRGKR